MLPSSAFAREGWDEVRIKTHKHPRICKSDDPTVCIQRLEQGERATFPGVMSTPRQAALLTVKAENADKRVKEAEEHQKKLSEIDLKLARDELKIEREKHAGTVTAMETSHKKEVELLKRELPSWYERPSFVIPVTVALTLVAVGVSAYAVERTRE